MTNEEQIIICAVRYALGRKTYIVGTVCKYVEAKKDDLSEQCKSIIARDIQEEYDRYHAIGMTLGDDCDEADWLNLAFALKVGVEFAM